MTLLSLIILAAVGLAAGFAGGMFGIGGGIIIVPALYATLVAGGTPPSLAIKLALGTSVATIIVTSARSVMRHHRHGNVEWAVLKSWAPFIGIGALMGAFLARIADGRLLTGLFAAGLIALSVQRFLKGRSGPAAGSRGLPPRGMQRLMATGTGLVSSLLGIGGGIIGVLILTSAGRTIHRAVGTAAGFGAAIALPGTVGYILAGMGIAAGPWVVGFVSVPGFLAVAAGTFIAAPWGASAAAALDERILTLIFAAYAGLTGILMMRETLTGG